mmetsp:Transcript_20326/g.30513  ORF Transcript_20326/g.30513 Transcript_20326/m.30513 type:complete len:337 (-) Transcript_20326:413-1423(-)
MPPLPPKLNLPPIPRNSFLHLPNSGGGFKRHMYNNVLPITNPTLYPTRAIGNSPRGARLWIDIELIIMLLPAEERPIESITGFKSLGGWYGHTGLGKVCFEFVKYGRTETRGYVPCDTSYYTANGVTGFANLINAGEHFDCRVLVWTTNDICIHIFDCKGIIVDVTGDVLDFGNVAKDLNVIVLLEDLPRNGTRGNTPNRLPGTTPPPTRYSPYSILGIIGSIRMRRPVGNTHIILQIIPGALILVPNQHGNGRARGDALARHAGEDFDCIGLVAGSGDAGLARAASVEVDLDFVAGEFYAGWAAVECDAYAASVGFAPGGDAEYAAEGVAGSHLE